MNIYTRNPDEIELDSFVRQKPKPALPPRSQWAQRISVAPRVLERFSQYIARINPPPERPKRDLNEEIGDVKYDQSSRSSCSPLVVIAVVSSLINIACVGIFLYQAMNDELIREEQCVLKKLIQDKYVKIYNNNIFNDESLIDKSCDEPLAKARQYVDEKIKILKKNEGSDDEYDEDRDRLNEKIDLTDLVMITQYIDKMVDGPRGCAASKCTILETKQSDKTSILCDFNYKVKIKED